MHFLLIYSRHVRMTQAKSDLKTEKNKKIRSEELVKEFEDFRNTNKPSQQNVGWESSEIVMNRDVRNDSVLEEIIDELQKLNRKLQKSSRKLNILKNLTENIISDVSQDNTTTLSKELPQDVSTETFPPPVIPLGLTSDQKRSEEDEGSQDFPQEDGTFVIVVVGITLCTIAGVVGLGCFIHKPSCPRPISPFSDCSPSFTSAKLAFSSSPEEKIGNSQHSKRSQFLLLWAEFQLTSYRNNLQSGNKGPDKRSNSRSEKFLSGVDQDSLRRFDTVM